MKGSPQYYRIYQSLRKQIENLELPVGSFLPTETELSTSWGVSRTTVRRAIDLLATDGFVYARQGRGTEVVDFQATQKLQYITSFSETLVEQGFTVGYRDVYLETVPATGPIAAQLRVPEGSNLFRTQRIALANRRPIAIMVNYLVPGAVPGIEKKASQIKSLYSFLESEYNVIIEAATDYISSAAASKSEADALEVSEGAPLLVVHRLTISNGSPLEWADLRIVAGRYVYSVKTKMRPERTPNG